MPAIDEKQEPLPPPMDSAGLVPVRSSHGVRPVQQEHRESSHPRLVFEAGSPGPASDRRSNPLQHQRDGSRAAASPVRVDHGLQDEFEAAAPPAADRGVAYARRHEEPRGGHRPRAVLKEQVIAPAALRTNSPPSSAAPVRDYSARAPRGQTGPSRTQFGAPAGRGEQQAREQKQLADNRDVVPLGDSPDRAVIIAGSDDDDSTGYLPHVADNGEDHHTPLRKQLEHDGDKPSMSPFSSGLYSPDCPAQMTFASPTANGKPSFIPKHLVTGVDTNRVVLTMQDQTEMLRRMGSMYFKWSQQLEERREARSVLIPAWDQACFKYLFHGAFESSIDPGELQVLVSLIVALIINVVVVALNVFQSERNLDKPSMQIAANIVFTGEFVLINGILLMLLIMILQCAIQRRFTTGFAINIFELFSTGGNFSTLQIVRLFSPVVILNWLLPMAQTARTKRDWAKFIFFIVVWLVGCVLAVLTVLLKVTQVGFVATNDLGAWTFSEYLLVLGLVLNIAKVDTSYDAVNISLLQTIHDHYTGPPMINLERRHRGPGWFYYMNTAVGIDRTRLYAFFSTVFDYHFGEENDGLADEETMTVGERVGKMLNFLSFVAQLDNSMLERLLDMQRSPMHHFEVGRQMFQQALEEGDICGMEFAVSMCDPLSDTVHRLRRKFPKSFHVVLECDNE
jgi:hypothetical protein